MSAAVMAMLAERWGCSVQEVRERMTARLVRAGLISGEASDVRPYAGESFARKFTLGVTDDDRVAVLDRNDKVLMWLD